MSPCRRKLRGTRGRIFRTGDFGSAARATARVEHLASRVLTASSINDFDWMFDQLDLLNEIENIRIILLRRLLRGRINPCTLRVQKRL